MKYLVILILILGTGFYFYSNRNQNNIIPLTDLSVALSKANEENKYLFVLFGRENCSNCQTLRSYIDSKDVNLPNESFIFADINCDNAQSLKSFYEHFNVEGNALPLVVVADLYGRQFATRSGYGNPEEFTKLIGDAVAHIERGY